MENVALCFQEKIWENPSVTIPTGGKHARKMKHLETLESSPVIASPDQTNIGEEQPRNEQYTAENDTGSPDQTWKQISRLEPDPEKDIYHNWGLQCGQVASGQLSKATNWQLPRS